MFKYNLAQFGQMIKDKHRMDAYTAALAKVVDENSVVADIGAGTGIFSLLAAAYGARRVFAIEPSEVIQLARQTVEANGFEDRIDLFESLSFDVQLPEKATVIISDLRSILPYFPSIIQTIVDARSRLLAPGGVLIPKEDRIYAALVSVPDFYSLEYDQPWIDNDFHLDMGSVREHLVNQWKSVYMKPERLVTDACQLASIDYYSVTDPDLRGKAEWEITDDATVHGICVWFDSTLIDSIGFSNSPWSPKLIYHQAFFPFPNPVQLGTGDRVQVKLNADYVVNNYIWSWSTMVMSPDGSRKKSYRQSTFFGDPVSKKKLQIRETSNVLAPNGEREIDLFLLTKIDGTKSIGDLAAELIQAFPDRFIRSAEAVERISRLTEHW